MASRGADGEPDSGDPDAVTLDEDFIRSATIKEPSARARMLTQKWSQQQASQAQASQALDASPPPRRRSRRIARAVTGGGLALAIVAAGTVALYPQWRTSGPTPPAQRAAPVAPPDSYPEETVNPAAPFAGSPAAKFATGDAGVTLPAARAVGGFSASEVAKALALARRYFVAANLDPATVTGDSPKAVLALLDPVGPRRELAKALRAPSKENDPLSWLSRFNPDETALAGTTIKVNGKTEYRVRPGRELVVHMDYLVVYAVRRARSRDREATRVVVRRILDFSTFRGRKTTPGTVWPTRLDPEFSGAGCDTDGGFLHPEYSSDPAGLDPSGPLEDPYDQSREPNAKGCHRVTRV
jgi:hypothetical protein